MSDLCLASLHGGAVYLLETGATLAIGRDARCQIVISDQATSRMHCRVRAENGAALVEDLESSNGTWVNGERITSMQLKCGDVLRVGNARFVVGTLADYLNLAHGKDSKSDTSDTFVLSHTPVHPSNARLIGGKSLDEVRRAIVLAAQVNSSILVTGESGTGKELVVRAIHEQSQRAKGPFVACNCAAFASELMESQLFGHRKGAFTGASEDHRGVFAQAERGTLFLDEISELPLPLQAKLLRVLENREYRPLGSERIERADVRVISASNRSLRKYIAKKRFREDLYYRLQVIEIHLVPLRERKEDIEQLVTHFMDDICKEMKRPVPQLEGEVFELLSEYDWPGNIRELRNYVERLLALTPANIIRAGQLQLPRHEAAPAANRPRKLADVERQHILATLRAAKGNKALAAKMLGIDRMTLYRKLESYNQR